MTPRSLRSALSFTELATFLLLLRSVAFDRWITVAASVVLLVAVHAAQRGRTWGVALSATVGITFAGLWALGIAPLWFVLVGLLALRPFGRLWPIFARFDRGAAVALAALVTGVGTLGALAWKAWAVDLFRAFPLLEPSVYPQHGIALLALAGGGLVARHLLRPKAPVAQQDEASAEPARVRVATEQALSSAEDAVAMEELESELQGGSRARTPG